MLEVFLVVKRRAVAARHCVVIHRVVLGAVLLVHRAVDREAVRFAVHGELHRVHIHNVRQERERALQQEGIGVRPGGHSAVRNLEHGVDAAVDQIAVAVRIRVGERQRVCLPAGGEVTHHGRVVEAILRELVLLRVGQDERVGREARERRGDLAYTRCVGFRLARLVHQVADLRIVFDVDFLVKCRAGKMDRVEDGGVRGRARRLGGAAGCAVVRLRLKLVERGVRQVIGGFEECARDGAHVDLLRALRLDVVRAVVLHAHNVGEG